MAFNSEGTIDELYKYAKQFVDHNEEQGSKIETRSSAHLIGSIEPKELPQQAFDQDTGTQASSSTKYGFTDVRKERERSFLFRLRRLRLRPIHGSC